jgi:hypothetical protein
VIEVTKCQDDYVVVPYLNRGFAQTIRAGVTVIHLESRLSCHCAVYPTSPHKTKQWL